MSNEEINARYPFLTVYGFDGNPISGDSWYRCVPEGWRDRFIMTCERVLARLKDQHMLDEYRITEVKEKFGTLRVYDNMCDTTPDKEGVSDLWFALDLATASVCVMCGEPAEYLSSGWICPYCSECKSVIEQKAPDSKFKRIKNLKK